ncbi:ATP synthase F0 subunit B [Leptolyngbya sp. 7M]|uniref:ATP synthase F0 subunit B n=1 Tax=Leptolyngbya sp. 7M TaxID=2812896 RepID=UPI001B8BE84E|nr:ATP synthase F0 subunit B [Leptolyngbya sp. 7M]QYO61933.1 ATP synthase F0 subunit B [Leptolyngbya sp. 7M]
MSFLAFAGIQLFPDGTLFIHIALILFMIWALNRTFFKPINAVLEKRSKQKAGRGGEADEILRDVAEKQKRYEEQMLAARTESYEIIETERRAAVDLRQTTIANARSEAASFVEAEKAALRDAVAEAKVEIALEAEKMADQISSTILKG